MNAPEITKEIYQSYVNHFGEPDDSMFFSDEKLPDNFPDFIDIMIWRPDKETDITTFSTIGMSTAPMKDGNRVELSFAIRKNLTEEEKNKVCIFIANLVLYPFFTETHLSWWHKLLEPGNIPVFKTAKALLFHPAFIENGFDTVETSEGTVKILNIVPLKQEEAELREIDLIMQKLEGIDIFDPR